MIIYFVFPPIQDRDPLQVPHDALRVGAWPGFLVWCCIYGLCVSCVPAYFSYSSKLSMWITVIWTEPEIKCGFLYILSMQDDCVALHSTHWALDSLVSGALSAAVATLCQSRRHHVRHSHAHRQQEVTLYYCWFKFNFPFLQESSFIFRIQLTTFPWSRQSYDISIVAQVDQTGSKSSNLLDLKNPFFRWVWTGCLLVFGKFITHVCF